MTPHIPAVITGDQSTATVLVPLDEGFHRSNADRAQPRPRIPQKPCSVLSRAAA